MPEKPLTEGLGYYARRCRTTSRSTIIDTLKTKYKLVDRAKTERYRPNSTSTIAEHQTAVSMTCLASKLSGGNQQRVVLANWLAVNSQELLVDEPTNGVDIGAKAEIHKMLRDLAEKCISIILVSSELPEILAIADRMLVMRRGRLCVNSMV
jgi:ABC-type sugar transport system ATPase subunit